jgi:hypothetical protein
LWYRIGQLEKDKPMASKLIPKWLKNEKQRAAVGFVAAGLAAVIVAGWTLFTYFNKSNSKAEVTYEVCVGPEPKWCPPKAPFVQGGQDAIVTWVNQECARYRKRDTVWHQGPAAECNCFMVSVKCSG